MAALIAQHPGIYSPQFTQTVPPLNEDRALITIYVNMKIPNFNPQRMPFPAVRGCRWLAPQTCAPEVSALHSSLPTTANTLHRSHMATPPTQPGHASSHFCFLQGIFQTPGRDTSGSSIFLLLWILPVTQISCQDVNCFPSFSPNFLSPVPSVPLNLLPPL